MNYNFQIFEPLFNNEELENEFNNFFYKYNLTPIFTNEHRAGSITVTYIDAKSVVNSGGSYHETLKELADLISMNNDNKSYEEALFRLIYKPRSFQGFMNYVKKHIELISSIEEEFLFNMWNIVWYAEELK